jgi:archaemetzincin
LLRFGTVDLEILKFLKNKLEHPFNHTFTQIEIIKEIHDPPKNSYDPSRKQYLSPLFLHQVRIYAEERNYDKILAITPLDFVFGQAEYGPQAKAAIISLHRLYPKFYHQPPNKNLFLMRVVKEAIHEIGHTFGLEHCQDECIMVFSNSILDTDNKPAQFCEKCRKKFSVPL